MKDPGTNPDRACRGADVELFFPMSTDISGTRQVINTFCRRCPVMDDCLEWALQHEGKAGHSGRSGIFGGATPRRRAQIYTARRKGGIPDPPRPINHGTYGGYRTHQRRGEVPCGRCTRANAEHNARRDGRIP